MAPIACLPLLHIKENTGCWRTWAPRARPFPSSPAAWLERSLPALPAAAGKSTLLRAMAAHEIRGIPPQCQILHVEQEVAGEDCTVMEVCLGREGCVWAGAQPLCSAPTLV